MVKPTRLAQAESRRSPALVGVVAAVVTLTACGTPHRSTGSMRVASTTTNSPPDAAGANAQASAPVRSSANLTPIGQATRRASTPPTAAPALGAAPGKYIYDVKTTSSGPPPQGGEQSSTATLRVEAAHGTDQHTSVADSQGNGEQYQFRYRDTGSYILDLRFTGQFGKDFKPNADAPLYAPTVAKPGSAWSWDMTSTDRSSTLHADFKVTGTDTVGIGDEPVSSTVIDGTIVVKTTYNGAPLSIQIRSTKWVSPRYELTVKRHDVTDVPALSSRSDTTDILESVHPG